MIFGGIQQLWPSSGHTRLRFWQGGQTPPKSKQGGGWAPLTLTTAAILSLVFLNFLASLELLLPTYTFAVGLLLFLQTSSSAQLGWYWVWPGLFSVFTCSMTMMNYSSTLKCVYDQNYCPSRALRIQTVKLRIPCEGGSVAEWLACWTRAQKGPGSNRSRDAVG